jgi:imidazole glycerol-phosphate synthase subunit HisH
MNKNNFFAVQFHPEKSAKAGEQVLRKFLNV